MNQYLEMSKRLIIDLGYDDDIHKVNLLHKDGQFVVDYEPCNFLRNIIESGRVDNITSICTAFNTFSTIEDHPFTKFIKSTGLYGQKLVNKSVDQIIEEYEQWFNMNINEFTIWCKGNMS